MGTLAHILLAVALATSVTVAGGGGPPPNQGGGVVREDGILGLSPARLPSRGQVCLGSSISMGFLVKNVSPGVEVPIPVAEAGVTVRDDRTRVRDVQTNAAGFAGLSWPAASPGTIRFTVDAAKTYYLPAAQFTFSVTVIPCHWALKVYFHEEYAIISEVSLVVGANVSWSGGLKSTPGQGEDPAGDISLAGGYGTWRFYASDKIQAPVHVALATPQSGEWQLDVRGRADGQTMQLELRTIPVTYPEIVKLKVTDYSNRGIEVKFMPPAPMSGGNGLFLELNKLSRVTFPTSGGVVNLDSGMSCYFYTPDRTAYSLTVMLYQLSEQGALVDGAALAGTVR